jgi:hypothetical protein
MKDELPGPKRKHLYGGGLPTSLRVPARGPAKQFRDYLTSDPAVIGVRQVTNRSQPYGGEYANLW